MSRRDIFEALAARGIAIHGKDPEMVLSTMLWRSQDRIVRLPPHGYWPADQDYRPASYIVGVDDLIGAASGEPEGGEFNDDDESHEADLLE